MGKIPNYIPIAANSQILAQPLNTSFSQLANVVNGFLDYNNIGSAGFLITDFALDSTDFQVGNWTVNGNLIVGGSIRTGTSNADDSSGNLYLNRSTSTSALFLGGSTASAAITFNAQGLNEFQINQPVLAGYFGSPALGGKGILAPLMNFNGSDSQATKVVFGYFTDTSKGGQFLSYVVNLGPNAVFSSSSSYSVFVNQSPKYPFAGATIGSSPSTNSNFTIYYTTNTAQPTVVSWMAIGF